MQKKIYWIASYPKSGNTWMRAIISSLLFTTDGKFNFGLFKLIEQFEKRKWFNFVNNEEFTMRDISKYWVEAQERIIIEDNYNFLYNFFKTHSLNGKFDKNDFTNNKVTGGIIYVVRDPRDVALSFSKHRGENIDSTIDFMINKNAMFPLDKERMPTFISRWDFHFLSWQKINVPKLLITFEELFNNTKKTLNVIESFLKKDLKIDIDNTKNKIENIIQSTKFEKLKDFEEKNGFNEATKNSNFFREGKIKQWEKELGTNHIKKIEKEFKPTMQKLGYL